MSHTVINFAENNSHPVIIKEKSSNCCVNCMLFFCIFTIVIALISPFYITDLVFAYTDDPCLTTSIPMLINLRDWLLINGFVGLSIIFLVIIISLIIIIKNNSTYKENISSFIMIFRIPVLLFHIAWLIIGSIIFWRYLEPSSLCNKSLNNYMWARLIIGFISLYGFKGNNKKQ